MEYQWVAYLYDGKSAKRTRVKVKTTVPGYITVEGLSSLARYKLQDVTISERLGAQPARVKLPDGSQLEIADADGFYQSLNAAAGKRDWLHWVESRWSLILMVLLVAAAIGWAAYAYGIPATARFVAYSLPRDIDRSIGEEGLGLLDGSVLRSTELSQSRQQSLRYLFADVTGAVGNDGDYQLEFRRGGTAGPNAFALPSGIVVVTDELVEIAEHDDEIAAVLAHEVGHVRNRHALRSLLQNSVVAGVIVVVTGDASFLSGIVAKIPSLLVSAAYSREFELEADSVARDYLRIKNIPLRRFADIIIRLDTASGMDPEKTSLLSTHPGAKERAQYFQ